MAKLVSIQKLMRGLLALAVTLEAEVIKTRQVELQWLKRIIIVEV